MDRVNLKMKAKQQMDGNMAVLVAMTAIIVFVPSMLQGTLRGAGLTMGIISQTAFEGSVGVTALFGLFSSLVTLAINFVIMPHLQYAYVKTSLDVEGGEPANINRLVQFEDLGKKIVLALMISIFTFLWSLLFIIPGIIKAYSYSMAWYILCENPEMTPTEALRTSMDMMNGHKMDLFVLHLSLIPWYLLVGITFGLAILYVGPYTNIIVANFYREIAGYPHPVGGGFETRDDYTGGYSASDGYTNNELGDNQIGGDELR